MKTNYETPGKLGKIWFFDNIKESGHSKNMIDLRYFNEITRRTIRSQDLNLMLNINFENIYKK